MKKYRWKKKPLLYLGILLVIGAIGVSYAIYQNMVEKENVFETSPYTVHLEENFEPSTWPEETVKEVSIVNEGTTGVVVRVSYSEVWTYEGTILNNLVNGENVVIKNFTESFLTDWIYQDGWYYYTKVLEGNSSIQILESIELNTEEEEYQKGVYELTFYLESVQASEEAVLELWGITVHIEEGEITYP